MSTQTPTQSPTPPTCNEWGVSVNCPVGKIACAEGIYKCVCDSQDCYYINGATTCTVSGGAASTGARTCNDPTTPPVPTVGPATMPPEYNTILSAWGLGGVCAGGIVFVTIIILVIIFFIYK